MDRTVNTLASLFDQLGLPSGDGEIEAFIARHKPLEATLRLHEAGWWNQSQAQFLRQAIEDDAEWAEPVDELDALFR